MTTRSQVDRLVPDALYEEYFSRMREGRPFVVEGAAARWEAVHRWTPKFLVNNYGSELVDFSRCGTRERVERHLSDYFKLPEEERSHWYLVDWDFRRRCSELLHDFSIPSQFCIDWLEEMPSRHRLDLMWIYIGHAGTYSPTHLDNFGSSAWLAVVQGRKRVVFPSVLPEVKAGAINPFGMGEDARVTHCAEALLGPGDVLFVPAGAWHAARNETYCLSVTSNFVDGTNFSRHRAFSMRGWFGPEMLGAQLDRLLDVNDPVGPERLRLHIAEALDSYQKALDEENGRLEALRQRFNA